MTHREKHLRIALSNAKHTFNEIDCTVDTPLAEKGMEDVEKAKQEADLMQDGPSEEDMERLELVDAMSKGQGFDHEQYHRAIKAFKSRPPTAEVLLKWAASKLKLYMGGKKNNDE